MIAAVMTRRHWLTRTANGFGGLALAAMLAERSSGRPLVARPPGRAALGAAAALPRQGQERHLPLHGWRTVANRHLRPQTAPREGALAADPHGKICRRPCSTSRTRSALRRSSSGRHGQSGAWVSELFPHVAQHVDDLCIVRSMVADHSEHTAAKLFHPHRLRLSRAALDGRLDHLRAGLGVR